MSVIELIFIAAGLSADAFAVAAADGMSANFRRRNAFAAAFLFGLFQALMPIAGYLLGSGFAEQISAFDHFLALGVLGAIGGKMISEAVRELFFREDDAPESIEISGSARAPGLGVLLLQAAATSIDALMVGVSFAAIRIRILPAAALIGAVTFALSLSGAMFGKRLGESLGAKATLIGGVVLAVIGVKTFLEHTIFQ